MTAERAQLSIQDALKQSRQTIISRTFAPLAQNVPAALCRNVSMLIGPHSFDVSLYAVQSGGAPVTKPAPPAIPPAPVPQPPKPDNSINPTLIAKLNAAAAADQNLAVILRKAAAGQANTEELGILSRQIDKIKREEAAIQVQQQQQLQQQQQIQQQQQQQLQQHQQAPLTPKTTMIAIKFQEAPPSQKPVVLPSHYSYRDMPNGDVLLECFVFPNAQEPVIPPQPTQATPVPVSIVLRSLNPNAKATLLRTSRNGKDASVDAWCQRMLNSVGKRVKVVHRPPTPPPEEERPVASTSQLPSLQTASSSSSLVNTAAVSKSTPAPSRGRGRGRGGRGRGSKGSSASPGPSSRSATPSGSTRGGRGSTGRGRGRGRAKASPRNSLIKDESPAPTIPANATARQRAKAEAALAATLPPASTSITAPAPSTSAPASAPAQAGVPAAVDSKVKEEMQT